jgi:hypothetical protein
VLLSTYHEPGGETSEEFPTGIAVPTITTAKTTVFDTGADRILPRFPQGLEAVHPHTLVGGLGEVFDVQTWQVSVAHSGGTS